MGIVMKKLALLATALALVSGSAFAADLRVKAVKAPPPPAFDPWDFAFGGGITNDYIFRGITQSNHKPSVNVYFEPRYNVTKDFQLYVGAWGYLYPGGTCQYGAANAFNGGTTDAGGVPLSGECLQNALVNSNVL